MKQFATFFESLSITEISRITSVIEKGLEVERLEYLASQDPEVRDRISDTCFFLSFLYFWQFSLCSRCH